MYIHIFDERIHAHAHQLDCNIVAPMSISNTDLIQYKGLNRACCLSVNQDFGVKFVIE